jgi:two-component system nitrate/nitrite sensor histidine kinase NarX
VPWDDRCRARFNDVESLWRTQRPLWLAEPAPAAQDLLKAGGAFVDASDRLVLVIEQHLSRLTAILNLFQLVMMAAGHRGGGHDAVTPATMYVINPAGTAAAGFAQG